MRARISMKRKLSQRPGRSVTAAAAIVLLAVVAATAGPLACGSGDEAKEAAHNESTGAAFVWPAGPRPRATLHVADFGNIEFDLYPELAPETVANFSKLAEEGFYAGTTFHRVIPGFMIQGGDPNSKNQDPRDDGQGGPGYGIPDEFSAASHLRGIVSMANSGRPNSGGSQFFIAQGDVRELDGQHTIFGRVSAGMDVVDAIASVEVDKHGRWGPAERPIASVVIERVTITPASAPEQPAG